MVELKPADLIVTATYGDNPSGNSLMYRRPAGIMVYHKPTDLTIVISHNKSAHKNRAEALVILGDLISEKKSGDVGYYINMPSYLVKREDGFCGYDIWDNKEGKCSLAYTEVAANYLARKQIDRLIKDHEDEIDMLSKKRKELY